VELTGGTFAETSTAGTVSAVVVPPSREFQPSESGTSVLAQIAAATGGTELSLDNLTGSTLFTSNGNADSAPGTIREIWQWPLAAFLLAFLLELAVRLGWLDMIRGRLGR
jgi:hypothetical protein